LTSISTSTLTSQQTGVSNTNESVGGLKLLVTTNASAMHVGQNLSLSISLVNELPSTLNVSASNDWSVNGFPVAMWGGCLFVEPVEFMIAKGNYSLQDLSTASATASISQGGCNEGYQVSYVDFQPQSSDANTTVSRCEAGCFPGYNNQHWNLNTNFTVSGYWAYPINSSEAADVFTPPHPECIVSGVPDCSTFNYPEVGPFAQHMFTSGEYTLVVVDEWGLGVTLHFEVATVGP
jgi:hypothetical protein